MLEFIQTEKEHKLYLEAQDSKGDKGIWFCLINPKGEQIDFDFLDAEKIYHMAVYLNTKLGFDFCNIENIKQIRKEEEEKSEK